MKYSVDDIEILEIDRKYFVFDEIPLHTPYRSELAFYDAIARGDLTSVEKQIHTMLTSHGLVVGKLSDNILRQTQYWAVSCITLAARAVIGAGMPEDEALLFADEIIRTLDKMQNPEEILNFITEQAVVLTKKMQVRKSRPAYPAPISAALREIHVKLTTNPSVRDIATEINISPDHLSRLFRKQFGVPLKKFIQEQRLRYARNLLIEGNTPKHIAYIMHYASESHFISSFRTHYGVTPRQFLIMYRSHNSQ